MIPVRSDRFLAALIVLPALLSNNVFPSESLTPPQRNRLLHSAIRIRYERPDGDAVVTGHGTAFGVDLGDYGQPGRRYLLSAAHNVVDTAGNAYPALKIELSRGSGTFWSRCEPVAMDRSLDLCLLECSEELSDVASLATADEGLNAPVIMAGSPRGIPVQLYEGTLVQRFYDGSVRSMAQIEFDHGCSGGPVYSADTGKVIGVAVAGVPKDGDLDHAKGLFVPVCAIESFISSLSPNVLPSRKPVQRSMPARPLAQMVSPPPQRENIPPKACVIDAIDEDPPVSSGKEVKRATPNAYYIVQAGDNLTQIARNVGLSVQELLTLNHINDADHICIGSKLRIR